MVTEKMIRLRKNPYGLDFQQFIIVGGLSVLLSPLVGAIAWFYWRDSSTERASQSAKIFWICVIANGCAVVLSFYFSFSAIFTSGMTLFNPIGLIFGLVAQGMAILLLFFMWQSSWKQYQKAPTAPPGSLCTWPRPA